MENYRRIMALDMGEKRIGVALSDPLGLTAQGLEVYQRTTTAKDLAYLTALFKEHDASGLLIGVPRHMNGEIGPEAEKIMGFGQRLGDNCGVEPIFWDERLTTVQAERALLEANVRRSRRRQVIDQVAAVLILENYLRFGALQKKED
ncbi:MAG TPA: Holliday junction resolvase RuvX [Firmicutes bacterium]|nr:Holliday junction resolvase RuvX [Bacillota bacterium]HBR33398.1 Holliday junction resolvase RuvX [Bacillota bacterium]